MPVVVQTAVLLVVSNVFMTFAWYAHLRDLRTVFVPFAVFYMRQPLRPDLLWAGLCLPGAVYFTFRR